MDEISIVKRRSRLLPIVLTLLVVAILILAALWLMDMLPGVAEPARFDVHHFIGPESARSPA